MVIVDEDKEVDKEEINQNMDAGENKELRDT